MVTDYREVKIMMYLQVGPRGDSVHHAVYVLGRHVNQRGIAGRGAAMAAESTRDFGHIVCDNCREKGRYKSDCPTPG